MPDPSPSDLLEQSIIRVWNERDAERRLTAIGALYHEAACIHEPERTVSGHAAISDVVAGVLADMPPDFRFELIGDGYGHHGMAVARWQGGPPGTTIVSGADAARVEGDKIREHWFFFDQAQSR